MGTLIDDQWQARFTEFCHNCFLFWKREGCSVAVAFDKAREETLALRHDPFNAHGQEVDLQALQRWNELYSQATVKLLYDHEQQNALTDLRICEHCGFPIFDGYYIAGEFYCCARCAIDGGYAGDATQFELDLEAADNPNNSMWDEVYWSQWDDPINE